MELKVTDSEMELVFVTAISSMVTVWAVLVSMVEELGKAPTAPIATGSSNVNVPPVAEPETTVGRVLPPVTPADATAAV